MISAKSEALLKLDYRCTCGQPISIQAWLDEGPDGMSNTLNCPKCAQPWKLAFTFAKSLLSLAK